MQLGRVQVNLKPVKTPSFKGGFMPEDILGNNTSKPFISGFTPIIVPPYDQELARKTTDIAKPEPISSYHDPTSKVEQSITTIIKTCAQSIGKNLPSDWEFKFPEVNKAK